MELKIINEIKELKKNQATKLSKFFASLSAAARKILLPKVVAALFGESSYEIDIMRYAGMYIMPNLVH